MNAWLLSKVLAVAVCGCFVFQLAACGTIIYPERRGQTNGEIDPAIAVLDGIGLVFFVVPGLIAFAIDFATGAIYLPAGKKARERVDELRDQLDSNIELQGDRLVVHVAPRELTPARIEALLGQVYGWQVRLDRDHLQAYHYSDRTDLPTAFAGLIRTCSGPPLAAL
jgi:hypothetical protein